MSSVIDEVWKLLEQTQGQIAGEIRVMLGEPPIDTANFTPADQERRIKAMKECASRTKTDQERHDDWVRQHVEDGWIYGAEFNSRAKMHPNLVPWEELPAAVKSKARIFDLVAKTGRSLEALLSVGAAS